MSSDYPSQPPYTPPPFPGPQDFGPQGSGASGKNRALSAPILIVMISLMIASFGAGIVGFVFGMLKSNEPYRHAVQVATNDARVQAKLGAPVTPQWFVSGNVKTSGTSGAARLSIPLQGSAHKGTIYVVARKSAGLWSYQTLELSVAGENDRLNLLAGSDSGTSPLLGTQQQQFRQQAPRARKKQPRTLIVAFLLMMGVYLAGVISLVFRFMKLSEPYKHAVQLVTTDGRVQVMLGPPVKPGWRVGGSLRLSGASGIANLSFPVQGSAQKGTVYVVARKAAGQWAYQRLELSVPGQNERVSLLV